MFFFRNVVGITIEGVLPEGTGRGSFLAKECFGEIRDVIKSTEHTRFFYGFPEEEMFLRGLYSGVENILLDRGANSLFEVAGQITSGEVQRVGNALNADFVHIVFAHIVHDDLRVIQIAGFAGRKDGIQKRKLADDTKCFCLCREGAVSGIAHQRKHFRWDSKYRRQCGEMMGLCSCEADPTETPWLVRIGEPACITGWMKEKSLTLFQMIGFSVNDHRSASAGDIVDQDIAARMRFGIVLQRLGGISKQDGIDIPHFSGKPDLYR